MSSDVKNVGNVSVDAQLWNPDYVINGSDDDKPKTVLQRVVELVIQHEEAFSASTEEPAQKMETLQKIFNDLSGITKELAGQAIDEKESRKREALQKELVTSKKGLQKILFASSKVSESCGSFLQGLLPKEENSKAAEGKTSIDQSGLLQASDAVKEFKECLEIYRNVDAPVVEKAQKEKLVPVPHVHADVVSLLKKYDELLANLSDMMKGALNTDIHNSVIRLSAEQLRERLLAYKAQFEDMTSEGVGKNFADLVRPVTSKLTVIENQVEAYESKLIHENSIRDIAIFANKTEDAVRKDIQNKQQLNAERKERHDELAKVWADVLVTKTSIEWELQRIELFTGIGTKVELLNNNLSSLEGKIEKTKDRLKQEVPKLKANQEELNKLLSSTKQALEGYYSNYEELASLGRENKALTEETLSLLAKQKAEAGDSLLKALGAIHLYDGLKKEMIETSSKKSLGAIQDEREELYSNLRIVWENVFKKLDEADNQTSLTYELIRLCYAAEKNSGTLPTDTFYKARVVGWHPEREPVKSPWGPVVVTEKKAEPESKEGQVENLSASTNVKKEEK